MIYDDSGYGVLDLLLNRVVWASIESFERLGFSVPLHAVRERFRKRVMIMIERFLLAFDLDARPSMEAEHMRIDVSDAEAFPRGPKAA